MKNEIKNDFKELIAIINNGIARKSSPLVASACLTLKTEFLSVNQIPFL